MRIPKTPLLHQISNSGPIAANNYVRLYYMIYAEDFFKLCSMIGHNEYRKITRVKFPKKSSFGPGGQFWPDCSPRLHKLISQDPLQGFFQHFQHEGTISK